MHREPRLRCLAVFVSVVLGFTAAAGAADLSDLTGTFRGQSRTSDGSTAPATLTLAGDALSGSLVVRSGGQDISITVSQVIVTGERVRMRATFAGQVGFFEGVATADGLKGRVDFGKALWFDVDLRVVADDRAVSGQPARVVALMHSAAKDSGSLRAFVDSQITDLASVPPPLGRAADVGAAEVSSPADEASIYASALNRRALSLATFDAARSLLGTLPDKARDLAERAALDADEANRLFRLASKTATPDSVAAYRKVLGGFRSTSDGPRFGLVCSSPACLEPMEVILRMGQVAVAQANLDSQRGDAALRLLVSVIVDDPKLRPLIDSRKNLVIGASGFYGALDEVLASQDALRATIGGLSRSQAFAGRADAPSIGREVLNRAASFVGAAQRLEPLVPPGVDERWIEVKTGDMKRGFRLATDGTVTYQGKSLLPRVFESPISATRIVVSPASPTGRYFFLQGCDGQAPDAPCTRFFFFDSSGTSLKVAGLGRFGADPWVQWLGNEKAALLAYTEGVTALYRFDPAGAKADKVPLETLCSVGEIAHAVLSTAEVGGETGPVGMQVQVKCDFFQDPRCDATKVKRTVPAMIDLASLSIDGPRPEPTKPVPVKADSSSIADTWVGSVQDKDKSKYYDVSVVIKADGPNGLRGDMSVTGLDCQVTFIGTGQEGNVWTFKGKESSKFRCMFMARMRAIPKDDGSIEWKVFTMSADTPRLHGLLKRQGAQT